MSTVPPATTTLSRASRPDIQFFQATTSDALGEPDTTYMACCVRHVFAFDRAGSFWARAWKNADHDIYTDPTRVPPGGLAIGEAGGLPNQERRNYEDAGPRGTGGSMGKALMEDLMHAIRAADTVDGGSKDDLRATFSSTPGTYFKLVEYQKDGRIIRHIDAIRPDLEGQRYYTVLIYLSDFEGGRTFFPDTGEYVDARTGDVLLFEGHKIPHACEAVTRGPKRIAIATIRLQ
jgi:hypothetical protein